MAAPARDLLSYLPSRIRKPAERLRTMALIGARTDPRALLSHWRHRRAFGQLERALFYHRYATAVLLAHEVGLFDVLSERPRTALDLAAELDLNPRSTSALVRVLESQGLVARKGRRYELAAGAEAFLADGGPFSLAPLLDLMSAQAMAFGDVVRGMKTGKTPRVLDVFSPKGRYRALLRSVNGFLAYATHDLVGRAVLPPVRHFIAGSMGVSASAVLLERFPESRVTFGCLPHLVREIPALAAQYGVAPERITGMHAHGGEPEADRWGDERYDLVLLTKKMILGPEERIGERFARKAFSVLRPGGVALLWETVHTDFQPTPVARAMEAVLDLGASPTGHVLTENGLRGMLGEIGYTGVEVVPCLAGRTTFVLARKPQ